MSQRKPTYLSATDAQEGQDEISALIRECIAKNRQAQKKLYDRFAPTAYGIIRRYTTHREMSDEILNDAFFKIFTKLDQYEFKGSFEGWMYRIVVHTTTDHLRKYIKEKERTDTREIEDNVHMNSDAIQGIAYKELLALIHELPDTPRTVFNLFVFEQYTHKEIAQLLDLTEGNSRWHLNSARKQLIEKITLLNQNRRSNES